jgi:dihydrolipoamide dehydrogenase
MLNKIKGVNILRFSNNSVISYSQFKQQIFTMKYDIIVLGSGPGGYVTAIRASQLGFKVAIIEKESLGGICLNWGCIPTKALLKSAQVFDYLKHAADYGLTIGEFDKDFGAVVARSRNVASDMSKGVQFLMKKNKIEVISGTGKLKPGKKIDVTDSEGKVTEFSADHIIICNWCPFKRIAKPATRW